MTTHRAQPDVSASHDAAPETPPCIETDVLVIGGGPAGSTIATLLARKGWQVTMLEKDRHPRFHIGESLLPMNMPILERLGALEKVDAIGMRKLGADFPRDEGGYNTFDFANALDAKFPHAYHVKREQFDQMLFEHARENGVDAREQVKVERVEFDAGDRPSLVHAQAADGSALAFRPRYVVDASGRDAFLGGKLKLKRKNPRHQSAAVFSHYRGVERRPGRDAGNVSIYRHEHGWAWLIPLADGDMSVGAVCYPDYLKTRKGDSEGFLLRTLEAIPEVKRRMEGAQRVAPVHVTGNYAYECTRMSGPGWLLVGDAWNFVDPMFSSGVYLGMHGAEQGAEVVDGALRDPACEARLQRNTERRLVDGLDEFKWFIYRFTSPTMKHLFANPQNYLKIEQAVVAMLAGDVFDSPRVRRRLRMFRVLYAVASLAMAPRALRDWWHRRRQARADFDGDSLQAGNP